MSQSHATADQNWSYHGLGAVILENRWLRAVILPEAGGKLQLLEDKGSGRQWLWQNPRIAPERAPFGSSFDNHWSGGADAFFPTCYRCRVEGVDIPDSGEWWSSPWGVQTVEGAQEALVRLQCGGRVFPVWSERTFTLEHDARRLTLGFSVRNVGHRPVPFVLGFHPALAIRPGGRLHLPEGTVQVDESGGPEMGLLGQRYPWPHLTVEGGIRDMGLIARPEAGSFAGHFLFPAGGRVCWAVTDPDPGSGLGLIAGEAFTGIWLWQVYGGWRGYYHVAPEPWTAYPITLDAAIEAGTARWIAPGDGFFTSLTLECFEDLGRFAEQADVVRLI